MRIGPNRIASWCGRTGVGQYRGTHLLHVGLDWELFRGLYRLSRSPIWQVDSHPDVHQLGSAIGVSPNTVWRTLRNWRRDGFLRAHVYFPNPRLFGLGFEFTRLAVSNAADHLKTIDRLELVDGLVVGTSEFGGVVHVIMVADSPPSRARRLRVLASLPGVTSVADPVSVWLPTPNRGLRLSDYRLIAAIRSNPDNSFSKLAPAVGLSGRTFSRRFRGLSTSAAVLTFREEDWSRFPSTVAILNLALDKATSSRAVAQQVAEMFPDFLELPALSRSPYAPHRFLSFLAEIANVSRVDAIEAKLGQIGSVESVSNRLPGQERIFEGWVENRMHEALNTDPSLGRRHRD